MKSGILKVLLMVIICVSVSGCSATQRRAFKGAAIGTGVGATAGYLAGRNVTTGALLGAGTGAAIGGLTK